MTRTITTAAYETLHKDGLAGPTEALLPTTLKRFQRQHDWDGTHWAMLPSPDGTILEAVNLRD